ncbi:PREDICTED: kallikrein-4-like [Chinchilla lanigera]|uniref:kallikrein-4-like n=1 Tax=Chinchilla lanigera TaxID=34839 RepID=UPI0006966764|nr:PREDICTED: kallikrein-4-like [Chinchilla lanigera]
MATTAQVLWLCFLGCVIHSAAEAEIPPNGTSNHIPGRLHLLRKRVTDGITCTPHSQPWIAALFDGLHHYCSGVLVHPQWVLSAAHCWRPSYTIGLGLHGIYDWFEQGSMIINARHSVKHPQYANPTNANDLMLIKLNGPVVESDTIRTIPIASECPTPETSCEVSGWGLLLKGYYPLDLQCAIIRVVAEPYCRVMFHTYHHDSMFCAGGKSRKNTCYLDSGGPLVCNGVLQGLVSGGTRQCGLPGAPGIYTKLCKFKEWINEIIQTT